MVDSGVRESRSGAFRVGAVMHHACMHDGMDAWPVLAWLVVAVTVAVGLAGWLAVWLGGRVGEWVDGWMDG